MNKYLLALAAGAVTASVVAPAANANELAFTDLQGYAQDTTDAVKFLVDKKIVNGTSATTFSPSLEITRGQVVKILGRYLENVEGQVAPADWNTKARFLDVAVNHKDQELVRLAALCYDAGIFTGSEGKLMTAGTMTRENLALVVNRLAKHISGGQDLVAIAAALGLQGHVTDLSKAKEEARAAINALNALQISNVAEYNPKGIVKRIQFTSLFAKMLQKVEDIPVADEVVKAFEAAVAKVDVATADEATLQAVVAQYEKLTAAQKEALSATTKATMTAIIEKLKPVVDEVVKAFEAAVAKVDVATADEATLQAVVAQYEKLTAAQKEALSATTKATMTAIIEKLKPVVDEVVKAFEAAVAKVDVATADKATLQAVVAQYEKLTAAQKEKLTEATKTTVTAIKQKLEDMKPTDPSAKTDAQILAEKVAAIGPSVSDSDVSVRGAGTTLVATVLNPSASLSSFMGLYGNVVNGLSITHVNGMPSTSFGVIAYLTSLVGDAKTLNDLRGKSFAVPITVQYSSEPYSTTLTLTLN